MPFDEEDNTRNIQKVSVSPKGTRAYVIYSSIVEKQGVLVIYNLLNRKKIDEIISVLSAVWIGNTHILYSSLAEDGGIFIYDVENKNSYEITAIQTVEARQRAKCQETNSFYDIRLRKTQDTLKYFGDTGKEMTIR